MHSRLLLVGGRVATPDAVLDGTAVAVEGDRVVAVAPVAECPFDGPRLDLAGALVTPGLIDTHVHGGLAFDTMDADVEAIDAISRHLAAHGVTGWLPTTVASAPEALDAVLTAVTAAMGRSAGARVLGAHLESNFIARAYKGAQPEQALRLPDDPEILAVLEKHRAVIRVFTLAPELPGALELIRRLVSWGVAVSVGHTEATYDQVRAAVAAGARRVTHLCNAQRPFHHREPGTVGAALVTDALCAEIIGDMVHVHPAGVQIAYRCKGPDGLMLVSDALRGTGLAPGTYELGGQKTVLDGRIARLQDGTIAGSTITLERAVANVVAEADVPLARAVAMASRVPAVSLGLGDRGSLAPGQRADLAVFDAAFRCLGTMVGGDWAFGPPKEAP